MSTGRRIELRGRPRGLDLPATRRRSCCCTRGSGSVRLWRDFPAALAEATGAARRGVLALRPRRLRPAAAPAHAALHARGGARRRCPPCSRALGHRRARARRPQRRRLDRAHPRGRAPGRAPWSRWRRTCSSRSSCLARDPRRPGGLRERRACARGWPATTATPTPRSTAGTTSGCDPEFPRWDIADRAAGITCPVLLIQGEHDQYGTHGAARRHRGARVRAGRARASRRRGTPRTSRRRRRRWPPRRASCAGSLTADH